MLRESDYETGYIGKWHLDGTPKPGHVPEGERRQGFEFWKGFNRGHAHIDEGGEVTWDEGYQPELQTDMAIDFMTEQTADENPFFCYLSWGPPHLPYEAPDEYKEMYDADDIELRDNVSERLADQARRDLVSYYGLITSLDDQMGRLLDALDTEGVLDETIVVFASDHGDQLGSQDRYFKRYPFEESSTMTAISSITSALRLTSRLRNTFEKE